MGGREDREGDGQEKTWPRGMFYELDMGRIQTKSVDGAEDRRGGIAVAVTAVAEAAAAAKTTTTSTKTIPPPSESSSIAHIKKTPKRESVG